MRKLLIIATWSLALTLCLDIYRHTSHQPYRSNNLPIGDVANSYQNQYPDIDQQHYYNQFQGSYSNNDQQPTIQQYKQYLRYDDDSIY